MLNQNKSKMNSEWRDIDEVREEIEMSLAQGEDDWVADRICEYILELQTKEEEIKKLKAEIAELKKDYKLVKKIKSPLVDN